MVLGGSRWDPEPIPQLGEDRRSRQTEGPGRCEIAPVLRRTDALTQGLLALFQLVDRQVGKPKLSGVR